jgi:POT family proton-dependent oligopeptide transporter
VTAAKPGFLAQIRSYPSTFWVANTMEIFERMAWYGWFTVMALYVTGSIETGGLGFSTETKGALMAIVPFFLYIFPVFTGALADRYGYKKIFIIAYLAMVVAYYMLGQFTSFPGFFLAFMFVAIAAALFKPVVVGTVAKVTDDSNSATGFGIFYMMINVGGFFGPIVAGLVRGWGWEWVFIACSGWALFNLVIVLVFYKEPAVANAGQRTGNFRKVLDNMVEVLGNVRFFITIFGVLFALMFANLRVGIFEQFRWWPHCTLFIPAWLILNFAWDRFLPSNNGGSSNPLLKRMRCSNWRFALFLLILSGFWTSYHQIFNTMPEYIRDFIETRPVIEMAESVFGESDALDPTSGVASKVATINAAEREEIVSIVRDVMDAESRGALSEDAVTAASLQLLNSKVRISPDELRTMVQAEEAALRPLADRLIIRARQVNPEFIVNIDAGSIILFQVLISFLMARFHRFTTMIAGMLIAAVGLALAAFTGTAGMVGVGGSFWIVAIAIFTIAIGEMMASPTSQEYVGRIAPADKKALYMGYYFVAMALGFLFGGILSGELYGMLARDMQRPDLMWLAFSGIMLLSAVLFLLYNRYALPKEAANELTNGVHK